MRIYLKNIGMIKEADVKLDGLTLIAGENDTGKSTVGKTLFILAKAMFFVKENREFLSKIEWLFDKVSKKQLLKQDTYIKIDEIEFDYLNQNVKLENKKKLDVIFIETPFIFNLYETFSGINKANSIIDFEIPFNYLWWDLYIKLSSIAKNKSSIDFDDIIFQIESILNGKLKKYNEINKDKWVFVRNDLELEMENIAMGMKQFAIIYALIKNRYLTKERILIIDEPEVHLHPKWQLKMAKLIVILVKKGIKIVVTSHSPYMVEALKKYSELEDLKNVNFYLAENNKIFQVENSNALTLEKIFEKLSAPFDEFDRLDEELMDKNG